SSSAAPASSTAASNGDFRILPWKLSKISKWFLLPAKKRRRLSTQTRRSQPFRFSNSTSKRPKTKFILNNSLGLILCKPELCRRKSSLSSSTSSPSLASSSSADISLSASASPTPQALSTVSAKHFLQTPFLRRTRPGQARLNGKRLKPLSAAMRRRLPRPRTIPAFPHASLSQTSSPSSCDYFSPNESSTKNSFLRSKSSARKRNF